MRSMPAPGECRAALERIVASAAFKAASRLTAFLRFVVDATLSGQAGAIKAYTIAVEALGRAPDFNPNSDPIVRVEAVRLRAALAHYYEGVGRTDPVVIALPRGRYVPEFQWRDIMRGAPSGGHVQLRSSGPAGDRSAPSAVHLEHTRVLTECRDHRQRLARNLADLRGKLETLQSLVIRVRPTED